MIKKTNESEVSQLLRVTDQRRDNIMRQTEAVRNIIFLANLIVLAIQSKKDNAFAKKCCWVQN